MNELSTLIQYHLQWLRLFTQVVKSSGLFSKILSTVLLAISNLCSSKAVGFEEIDMMSEVIGESNVFMRIHTLF